MLKKIESYLDKSGYRGFLRTKKLYKLYKILKGSAVIFNPFVYELYSRKVFRDILKGNRNDVYSCYINSFKLPPEDPIAILDEKNPMPWMYIKAIHFIEAFVCSIEKPIVFEYGSGASTLYFNKLGATVYSAETVKIWEDTVNQKLESLNYTNKVIHVDPVINLTSRYKSYWPEYANCCFEKYVHTIEEINQKPNIVLIDGECRVECLKLALKTVPSGSLIVLDNSKRIRYAEQVKIVKSQYRTVEFEGPTTYSQGFDSTLLVYT